MTHDGKRTTGEPRVTQSGGVVAPQWGEKVHVRGRDRCYLATVRRVYSNGIDVVIDDLNIVAQEIDHARPPGSIRTWHYFGKDNGCTEVVS